MAYKNKEDRKIYDKEYYSISENRKRKNEINKKWRDRNKEYCSKYGKQYRKDNPEKIKESSEKYKSCLSKRYRENLKFNIDSKMRSMINESLKGNKSGWYWEKLVGYTLRDIVKHLKSTMPEGYSWQDYINGKLQIDHIIPISIFNYSKVEHPDFKRCWALENLRLLTVIENKAKSNKLTKSFQPALVIKL